MTPLSEIDHKSQMEDMRSFDGQMPCVGIFWYDSEGRVLFGVRKKELTPQMVEEAARKVSSLSVMVSQKQKRMLAE